MCFGDGGGGVTTYPCVDCQRPCGGLRCEACRAGRGGPERWVFDLPLPPNRANSREHWRSTHRKRSAYYKACADRLDAGMLPRPPRKPLARARLTVTLHVWNRFDPDGAVAVCKWPVDWLVTLGYVEDDKTSVLEWAGIPTQIIDRQRPRVVLTLEPIREEAAA